MTVAGNGVPGFSGDGGDAKFAQVSELYRSTVVTDEDGNIFFGDNGNFRIRRIDRKTGVITTFAGNGGRGYSGDGGPATLAEISKPWSISIDWKGNLLILDTLYCRIRSVTPSGTISYLGGTVCGDDGDGGNVNAAKVYAASILASDSGRIYLAGNTTIRVVDPKGIISRFAGSTYGFAGDGGPALSAKFSGVSSLALNKSRELALADGTIGRRVRQIDTKGIINTIAGNGSISISGDGGKGLAAGLGMITGIAYDQFGNVFISGSNFIRKVDFKDSIITTIAGTGTAGYGGEGVDAKTSTVTTSLLYFDTAYYELYFFDYSRLRKITNLIKPVSINETVKTYTPEIFPNPATREIHVSGVPIHSEIWIYDLLGREQYHATMQEMEVTIDIGAFECGLYLLKAKTPEGTSSYAKFWKQ